MDAHYLYRSLIPSSPSSSSGDLACRAVCRGRFSRSDTDQIVICRGSFVELLDITGDGKLTRFMIQPAFAEVLTVASLTMRAQDEMQDLLVMTSRSSVSVLAFAVALGRFVPITHINGSDDCHVCLEASSCGQAIAVAIKGKITVIPSSELISTYKERDLDFWEQPPSYINLDPDSRNWASYPSYTVIKVVDAVNMLSLSLSLDTKGDQMMAEDGTPTGAPALTGMTEQEKDEGYVDVDNAEGAGALLLHGEDEHGNNSEPGKDSNVLEQVSDPDDDAGLGSVLDMCWCHERSLEGGAGGSSLRLVALVIRPREPLPEIVLLSWSASSNELICQSRLEMSHLGSLLHLPMLRLFCIPSSANGVLVLGNDKVTALDLSLLDLKTSADHAGTCLLRCSDISAEPPPSSSNNIDPDVSQPIVYQLAARQRASGTSELVVVKSTFPGPFFHKAIRMISTSQLMMPLPSLCLSPSSPSVDVMYIGTDDGEIIKLSVHRCSNQDYAAIGGSHDNNTILLPFHIQGCPVLNPPGITPHQSSGLLLGLDANRILLCTTSRDLGCALTLLSASACPSPHSLVFQCLDQIPQLGHILDLTLGHLNADCRPQVYMATTSGGADGMEMRLKRVSFSLTPSNVLTYHNPPDGLVHPTPSHATPLSISFEHNHHSLLLLSYLSGTRLLRIEPDTTVDGQMLGMRDISEELPFEVSEPTLACGLISDGVLAQVTPSHVVLIDLSALVSSESCSDSHDCSRGTPSPNSGLDQSPSADISGMLAGIAIQGENVDCREGISPGFLGLASDRHRRKVAEATGHGSAWYPRGGAGIKEHVVMATVAPGCIIMACAHSQGLRALFTAPEHSSGPALPFRDEVPRESRRKRGREGLPELNEAQVHYPYESSCLKAISVGSSLSATRKYLVMVGHYGSRSDSGSGSVCPPGVTLLLLSAYEGEEHPSTVTSAEVSEMPTSGNVSCQTLSECSCLPPGFPSSFESISEGGNILSVPESVLFMDPSVSTQAGVSDSLPERVRWLVGYRQGLLALYQWTSRSGQGCSESLWNLQLGDLPLTLSPLEGGRSALVMGSHAYQVSISPLNDRLVASTLSIGDAAALTSLTVSSPQSGESTDLTLVDHLVVIHTNSSWSVMALSASEKPMLRDSLTKSLHTGVLSLPSFSAATILSNQQHCLDQPGSIPCRLIQLGSSGRLLLLSASHTSVDEDEESVPWSDFFWDEDNINDTWEPNPTDSSALLPSDCGGRWTGRREKRQHPSKGRGASIRLLNAYTGTTLGSYTCEQNTLVSCLETWDADVGPLVLVEHTAIPHLLPPRSHAISVSQSVSSGGGSRGTTSGGGGGIHGGPALPLCESHGAAAGCVGGGSSLGTRGGTWPLGASWMREDEDAVGNSSAHNDHSVHRQSKSTATAHSGPVKLSSCRHETLILLGTNMPNMPQEETAGTVKGHVTVLRTFYDGALSKHNISQLARVALPDSIGAVSGLPGSPVVVVGAGRRLIAYKLIRGKERQVKASGAIGWRLKRLTWIWLSSPASQISTTSGSTHMAVKHQGGHVTMFEYIVEHSGGPMLKAVAANSLSRSITSLTLGPAEERSVKSSTDSSPLLTSTLPSVLTLDNNGCFAGLYMPPSVGPFRNLQEVAFFRTSGASSNIRCQPCYPVVSEGGNSPPEVASRGFEVVENISAWLTHLFTSLREGGKDYYTTCVPLSNPSFGVLLRSHHSRVAYDMSTGFVSSMTEIHGQAAIWLACIEASILETCPAARPLIGIESHQKYRGHLQHHQISLTCSSPERRHVLDGDLLDLVLTLPRKQQRAAFATAWQRYAQTQCHLVKKADEAFSVEHIPSASPTDLIFWTSGRASNQDLQEGRQQSHDGNELSCDGEVCLIPPAAELGLLLLMQEVLSMFMV